MIISHSEFWNQLEIYLIWKYYTEKIIHYCFMKCLSSLYETRFATFQDIHNACIIIQYFSFDETS